MLLLMLDISFQSEIIPVYYYDNHTGKISDVLFDDTKRIIASEKMGGNVSPADIKISTMGSSNDTFRNLIFDEEKFKRRLTRMTDNIEMLPERIVEFEDCVRVYLDVQNDIYFETEYLINTIPQPFFAPMVQQDLNQYKFKPLVFVSYHTNEENHMTYSYNQADWKRIFVKNGIGCIEFDAKDYDPEAEILEDIRPRNVTTLPYGRIASLNVPDSKRIIHIGRFAQWDHKITTEHVINKLINLNV